MSDITCSVDGCDRTDLKGVGKVSGGAVAIEARGLCDMHYQRWKRHGDPTIVLPGGRPPSQFGCTVEGCNGKHHAKGLCDDHYERRKRAKPATQEYRYNYRKSRGWQRKYITGWTPKEYEAALVAQRGCCAMCGRDGADYKRPLHADHCHKTGTKRALLCPTCNSRIEPVLTRYFSDPDFRLRWQQYLSIG